MRLVKFYRIYGTIEAVSGLRVGGEKEVEIGGIDNPVIRNPLTGLPYIPGSSIKGKMRSLIEWSLGGKYLSEDTKHPHQCNEPDCPVCRVFGAAAEYGGGSDLEEEGASGQQQPGKRSIRGPTRLLVRDANLTEESRRELERMNREKGLFYTEAKQEVFIPRLGGPANPRTTERVPAGAKFTFEMVYRVYDTNDNGEIDEKYFQQVVKKALKLLEIDGLGGHTSRGYGKIRIEYSIEELPASLPLAERS